MSILIKGMKMPQEQSLRMVLNPNGKLFVDHGYYFDEYEAVEVPTPHGRLVDADALKATFCAECNHTITCEDCDIDYHIGRLAPTIIEAEEGEEA